MEKYVKPTMDVEELPDDFMLEGPVCAGLEEAPKPSIH